MENQMSKYRYFPCAISKLKENEIFVFGSNLAGRHGAGAARIAMEHFGARYGVAEGITGQCYAIPTKDWSIETLDLDHIGVYIAKFLQYAKGSNFDFIVTQIGCGLAGYKPRDIAPMFKNAPLNCIFDLEWKEYLE
jgi:hypothetical protein